MRYTLHFMPKVQSMHACALQQARYSAFTKLVTNEKTGITEDYIITKSIDIKNYWQELTGEQKNKIWQYFQNMITCTERYVIMSMKK